MQSVTHQVKHLVKLLRLVKQDVLDNNNNSNNNTNTNKNNNNNNSNNNNNNI